jgi:hypothetical protein
MKKWVILVLMAVVAFPGILSAQTPGKPEMSEKKIDAVSSAKYRERLEELTKPKGEPEISDKKEGLSRPKTEGLESIIPQAPGPEMLDPKTKERYLTALQHYYEYRISGYEHRRRVFEWQLFSSKFIFVVVLVLVLAGIYFAAVQFHTALGRKEKEEVTEFVASATGIKVSSPVLGVIILVISLAFFYLYLVYVYPITEIF